ncbi:hypothetical protein D7D52_33420 [Nocardia yunnanensis]|uniref:PPM-type phosphatase domain-containing protein n=1 Tax=Nocardia yunnanensis TaxID=2382165 RepID=A0A386ZKG4_9NOCA|nr:protein phosphatase 2C domain-containing protein [Nocardia yunnanensis]AYF77908.1 hypothetical protein D7D52_33420 [Nocardia yunnanensis]
MADVDAAREWPSSRPIVVGSPTPEFEPRAVDDSYRTWPYRPDTVLDGWTRGPFTIRAASMRGHLHRYQGAPRQDDFAIAATDEPPRLVIAVADGVSAAPHSHIGAGLAVQYAVRWLTRPEQSARTDWRVLFEHAAWALIERAATLLATPEVNAEQAEAIVATTLTCAVCAPHPDGGVRVEVAGVGDSGAWLLREGRFTRIAGGKTVSDDGLTSSAVLGLPRIPDEVVPVEVVVEPGAVLLLGTDGFGDPLGGGAGEVGALFTTVLGARMPSLVEFAHALDFSRETFDDDRTLVALWPRPAVTA